MVLLCRRHVQYSSTVVCTIQRKIQSIFSSQSITMDGETSLHTYTVLYLTDLLIKLLDFTGHQTELRRYHTRNLNTYKRGRKGGGGVKAEISKSPPKKTVSRHRLLLCRVYDQCRSMHLVRDIQEKKNCPVYLKQVYKMAMPPKEENKKKEEREFTCTSS